MTTEREMENAGWRYTIAGYDKTFVLDRAFVRPLLGFEPIGWNCSLISEGGVG